jgi:hypothetical protein
MLPELTHRLRALEARVAQFEGRQVPTAMTPVAF